MSSPLIEYDIADLMPVAMRPLFDTCVLVASEAALRQIVLTTPPTPGPRRNDRIEVVDPDFQGILRVALGPGSGRIRIESRGRLGLDLRTWRQVDVWIGAGTTINAARMVCDNADIRIGEDGLWSDEVLIQSNDQHGIIDLETMALLGSGRRSITMGAHVWIGRRTIVMPDTTIGQGSILGAGAVLTSDMPENAIFAGVPARLVRSNVSWSRSPSGFSAAERMRLELPDPSVAPPET